MKPLYETLPTRNEILEEAARKCLDRLFRLSTPSTTWKEIKEIASEWKKNSDERILWQDHHYISQELKEKVVAWYKEAYKVESEWFDNIDLLKDYLKKEPITERKPLEDAVGEDKVKAVLDVIDECKNYYNRDNDSSSFEWTIFNLGPTTNKEFVEEYWKTQGLEIHIDEEKYKELIEEL